VQGYTRRQLKEDKFSEKTKDAMQWTAAHQRPVFWVLGGLLIAMAGYFGYTAWDNHQNEAANAALGSAMRTFNSPLRPAGAPAADGDQAFPSLAERAKAAGKQFKAVADQYSYTKAGKIARYMEGVAAMQAGDNAGAEQNLKSVAGSGDKNVAALAKLALASQYRANNKISDATRIYKDLQDHPTDTVSKAQAQLAMAEMYENSDPQQAASIYQQIQKENSDNPAGQFAAARLATVK
jgi:predicted negative regulator of RcsB-dependent stress response